MPSRLTQAILAVLLIVTAAIYVTRLGDAPIYLMQDEVNFALQAQAIRSTGHDTNGRLLPAYFSEAGFEAGRDPIIIYAQALSLTVLPLSEFAVRLPTALLGVVNVLLMFLVGKRVFGNQRAGLLAAALLAVTPAHFVNSRLALSVICPVPFILVWLLCLTDISDPPSTGRQPIALIGAGLTLGIGVFSYVACLIMMPLYLALTVVMLWERRQVRTATTAIAAFAIMMIPLVWWQIEHPNRYAELLRVYRPYDVQQVRERINVLWSFFSPDYLFVSGDSRVTNSVRSAGMFSIACALLIPLGAFQLARGRRWSIGWVILIGFLSAPLASAVSGKLDINRVLFALPFGVLLAIAGAEYLLAQSRFAARALAIVLLIAAGIQFWTMYADYIGPYRTMSAPWFGGNASAAVNEVLRRADRTAPPIYLNLRTPIERYWRFYALKKGRADLVDRPRYYDPGRFDLNEPAPGALLVSESAGPVWDALQTSGAWSAVSTITEPGGAVSFVVYERR